MRVVLTGTSGIVGQAVLAALRRAGHEVSDAASDLGWRLGRPVDLSGHEALIHCAFAHEPGRYRGGEGDDPQRFLRLNLAGSNDLFDAALRDGLQRVLFLSSRAVHDGWPPGTALPDDLPARPVNLYGQVKALAEAHLAQLPIASVSIRATGVYGPGPAHKWQRLFATHLAGDPTPQRVATELHIEDLAAAILLLLDQPAPPSCVNASDLVLDHHDLLSLVNALSGAATPPPPRSDAGLLRIPQCRALRAMGWRPSGMAGLRRTLPLLLRTGQNVTRSFLKQV